MAAKIPSTMRAIVIQQLREGVIQYDRPVPELAEDEILVKIGYVALNPTDFKHLDDMGNPTSGLGCDYSGRVVALGANAKKFQVGDRVFGNIHGGKFKDRGAFAEYAKVKEGMALRAPDNLKDEELAPFGVGFITAAMAVFHHQKNPYPPAEPKTHGWFLVSGGSTSVGLFTLSLLAQLGIPSVATASPKNFDLVKSYGASHVVDYHDPDKAVEEIKAHTGGGVVAGLECIGGMGNFGLATSSFKDGGGLLTCLTIIPDEAPKSREDVKLERILLYTVGGYTFEFYPGKLTLQANPEDHAWYLDFVKRAEGNEGIASRTKPNLITLGPGGLDGVLDGLDVLRQGRVSASKLVYKIAAGQGL